MAEQVDSIPDMWAVLIGIDYYEDPEQPTTTPRRDGQGNKIKYKTLLGCVNDVLAIEQYLLDTIKVNPKHIKKLLAPCPGRKYLSQLRENSYRDPSYDNMVDTLKVPEGAKKGDFVYIHFSGHGARATTIFPELKDGGADAEDQALVPVDVTRGGEYLRDLEMGILLQAMVDAGLVVTVVLDCCHSGGAVRGNDDSELGETRGIAGVYKSDPELDVPRTINNIMHWGHQPSWMHTPQGFVVLAACEELQTAKETSATDNAHGILTFCLLEILRNSPVDSSSQALYERICAKVQDSRRDQTPYLIGDKDRFFFSKKLRPRVYALTVRAVSVDTRKEPIDRSVRLAGGKLHGVEEESEYAILPWGFDLSKRTEDNDILGRVQVKHVMTEESLALFTPPYEARWEEIKDGCPAVLQKLPIKKKSTVRFLAQDENARDKFKENWHRHNGDQTWLSLDGNDDDSPFFTIAIDDNGNFEIRDRSGNFTPAIASAVQPLPAAATDSMPALIRRLEHLARFKMTRELANPGVRPGMPSALISIKVENAPEGMKNRSGKRVPPANIEERDGMYEVDEMTLFRVTIKNESGRPLGCVVLNCGAEFGIEQLFPAREPYYMLSDGKSKEVDIGMVIAAELRASAASVAFMDTLMIFVCDPPRNLDSLQLQSLREMEEDGAGRGSQSLGLDDLLNDLDKNRKGFTRDPRDAEKCDWGTMDVKIRIRPLQK
ncbi:hypothetical protein NCS55_01431400 [Fusarium keratoplasticum]|nr:hypothetical protein NCS55_01431400 [Fusarium keratoplasticum]